MENYFQEFSTSSLMNISLRLFKQLAQGGPLFHSLSPASPINLFFRFPFFNSCPVRYAIIVTAHVSK